MKIITLELNNTRKIKAFKMKLDGKNLHVAGETAQGKTTAISALWEILEKKNDSITHGEKKGEIKIKLSDGSKTLVAKRINTEKSSVVKLTDSEGDEISMADFKKMISDLSVNPHKIKTMKPKEQVNTLLKAAKVTIDLEKAETEIKDLEEKRLQAKRDLDILNPGIEPEKVEEQNVNDLVEEKTKLVATNTENEKTRSQLDSLKEREPDVSHDISESENNIENILEQIEELKETLKDEKETLENKKKTREDLVARIKKGEKYISELKDEDLTEINNKIANVQENNNKATAHVNWLEATKKHTEAKEKHEKLNTQVMDKQSEKKKALDSAKWPIKGLAIEDGKIYYNKCLLENLGESEQILVCSALAINDIKKHPIKVVRLDGVESMSKKDLGKLVKLFNDEDIQVLSTRVSRGDKDDNEIIIVDGEYKND